MRGEIVPLLTKGLGTALLQIHDGNLGSIFWLLVPCFCPQSLRRRSRLQSCWPWAPHTCGSNPTPTPSSGTGPSSSRRWSTGPPQATGQRLTSWTLPTTSCGTWTPTWSTRSECCWRAPGKGARGPPGHPSPPEPSVQVRLLCSTP